MRAGTTNEKERGAGLFHLIVRILTLPPIVIGITVLLMYVPAKLLTLRELLLCELFLLLIPMAAYPIREIFHIGKDRRFCPHRPSGNRAAPSRRWPFSTTV